MEKSVTVHIFQNSNVFYNPCFIDSLCIRKKEKTMKQGTALIILFPVALLQHRQRCVCNADVPGSARVRVVRLSLLLGGEDGVSMSRVI